MSVPENHGQRSSPASLLVRGAISLGLLAILFFLFRDKLPQAWQDIRGVRAGPLLLAFLWYLIFILVSAWRWKVLLAAGRLYFSTWYLVRVFTLGLFFCKLLPTSIGGDVMRIAYTARKGKTAEAFSATFLDRLIGFVSLSFLAVLSALGLFAVGGMWKENLALRKTAGGEVTLAMRGEVMFAVLLGILVILTVVTLALFSDRVHRLATSVFNRLRFLGVGALLDKGYRAVKDFRQHRRALGASFGLGIGVQCALSFSWFHTARALGAQMPLVYFIIFVPVLNIVVNVPSIGGLGVREASFVALFTQSWLTVALSDSRAFAVAILFLCLDLVFSLVGGIIFALMRRETESRTNTEDTSVANT